MKRLVKDLVKYVEGERAIFDEKYKDKKGILAKEDYFKVHITEKLASDDPEV